MLIASTALFGVLLSVASALPTLAAAWCVPPVADAPEELLAVGRPA